MENKNYYKTIIASYLHDIGKLFVRAGFKKVKNNLEVSHAEHLLNLIQNGSEYVKENFGENNDLQSKLEKISNSKLWQDIAIIGSYHHGNDFGKLSKKYGNDGKDRIFRQMIFVVYMADNLASKDRINKKVDNENNVKEEDFEKTDFKTQGLTSIFENIFDLSDKKDFNNNFSYEAKTIDDIGNFIPQKNFKVKNFKGLAIDFLENLIDLIYSDLELKNPKNFINTLDILIQKYFTFVPSDVYQGKVYDLSLYDHTKLVVANAVVLYNKFFISGDLKDNLQFSTKEIEEKEISLIAGDFPSIQTYIFEGIKKQTGIAKRLRARSLRVQLLSEAVIEYILDKLNLPRANVIMNAGGKFVILYDKIGSLFEKLKLKENINDFLLEKFSGNIAFNLVSKNYKIGELFNLENSVKDVFADLFDELGKQKFKIYSKNNLEKIFSYDEKEVSGKILCKYCGQNYIDGVDENSEDAICKNCEKEKKLGEQIVKEPFGVKLKYKDEKGNFYYNEEILKKENFKDDVKKEYKNNFFVIFNKWEYIFGDKNKIVPKSINLYVPFVEEEKDGKKIKRTKDFEEIIKDDKQNEKGLDYICLLKGDIDAMSMIFKYGFEYNFEAGNFKNSFYSVNRLTQFSRFLELFFGTYLNKKIAKNFPNVYTVFSGGDDFVFVVPFGKREDFINFLYEEFNKFVAGNPKIHFSIGLGIFKDKTPFKKMDKLTEKLLKEAKYKAKEKNLEFLEDNNKVLNFRGLTIYEKDFTKVFSSEEKIDFREDIKKFVIKEQEKEKLVIGDTQNYKLYSELKRFREFLKEEKYSDCILIGARILNMLERNDSETKKKEEFKKLREKISDLIKNFETKAGIIKKKIEKINKILLGLVDSIYEERYKN